MSDLGTLLREHYESIAPPIDVDRMVDRLLAEDPEWRRGRRLNSLVVAVGAAVLVLLVVGGTALLIRINTTVDAPVIGQPTTTIVPAPVEPIPEAEPGPIDGAQPSSTGVGLPFTVLDREGDVGRGATVIVGADGIPLLAYVRTSRDEGVPSQIRIATCADPACTSPGVAVTIAETLPTSGMTTVGNIAAIMPPDGLPLITWIEWGETEDGNATLRVYKCVDTSCVQGTLNEVGAPTAWGWVELRSGPDGLPRLAFQVQESIVVVKCGDASCSGGNESSVVDLQGAAQGIAMTIDEHGFPVMAFGRTGVGDGQLTLAIARCTDQTCVEAPPIVDLGVSAYGAEGIRLDAAGNSVIVAVSRGPEGEGGMQLVLVACTDPVCEATPVITTLVEIEADGERGFFGSMELAPDGSVTFVYIGQALSVITCDSPICEGGPTKVDVLPGGTYSEVDIALGPTGNPVIAIYANTDTGVFVCEDRTCASSRVEPISPVPGSDWAATNVAPGDVQFSGANPSIEIDPDGNPVIAYLGLSDARGPEGEPVAVPKLLFCQNTGCTTSTAIQIADGGNWPVMAMGSDGVPVVAYSEWGAEDEELFLVWCSDVDCSERLTEKVDEGWFAGPTAITLRADGSAVAVYQNIEDYYVHIVDCAKGACTSTIPKRVDSLIDDNGTEWGMRWYVNSIAIALLPDGRPVIAVAQLNGELRYVECLDVSCSQSTMTVIADRMLDSATATLAIGPDGLPIFAFYNDGALTIAACHDTQCREVTLSDLGEATASFISSVTPSLAFGPNGFPMVAYWAPQSLMIAECHDSKCLEANVSSFAAVRTYDLATLPDGSPVLTYFVFSEGEPATGDEEFQRPVDLWVAACLSGPCVGG